MIYNNEDADNFRPDRHRTHYLSSVIRRWRSYIVVGIAAILVLSAAATVNATVNAIAESKVNSSAWLASQYQISNALESEQVAVYSDTTVRLLFVIPSSSETLVELVIEDPEIGKGWNDATFFPVKPDMNLNLTGFSANNILGPQRSEVAQGKQRIVLDLPPLSEVDATVTIELRDLIKRNASTGALTTITGPWQLSFTPKVRAEQLISRNFNVNKQIEVGDVQVLLEGGADFGYGNPVILSGSGHEGCYERILGPANFTMRQPGI